MPDSPRKGESKEDFIARCMKYLAEKEGKTGKPAAGQCYGMWDNRGRKKKKFRIRRKKKA